MSHTTVTLLIKTFEEKLEPRRMCFNTFQNHRTVHEKVRCVRGPFVALEFCGSDVWWCRKNDTVRKTLRALGFKDAINSHVERLYKRHLDMTWDAVAREFVSDTLLVTLSGGHTVTFVPASSGSPSSSGAPAGPVDGGASSSGAPAGPVDGGASSSGARAGPVDGDSS